MSAKQLKSELTDLLKRGLAQRGFSFEPLKKKEPNANRHLNFRKLTPGGSWSISLDVLGRSCIASGASVSISLHPSLRIDALSELLDDQVFLTICPGSINRGDGSNYSVSDGEDPAACVRSILDTIDSIVLPRFEKYSSLENVVECIARLDENGGRELDSAGFTSASSAMAAIGGAYLLGKLDLCDDIARRAEAKWEAKTYRISFQELLERKQDFYERHLRARGVKPDAWLLSPEREARLRAERPPKPHRRTLPSPTIWIDDTSGAEVPARFEYGCQRLVIGTDNREFVQSLTEVAHKLTTGRYNLMMVAAGRPGEKPSWGPYPVSYRRLVIDGTWAVDWTPPPPSTQPPQPAAGLSPAVSPSHPTKDPNPDDVSITNKHQDGWSPFYYRKGYAMYPKQKDKAIDQAESRELIPTLTEVAARLRSGEYALMMSHERTGYMEVFSADALLIDGKPAVARPRRGPPR